MTAGGAVAGAAAAAAAAADVAAALPPMPEPHSQRLVHDHELRRLVESHDVWVFDLDGTIWRGDELIPNAAEALALLRRLGRRVVFVTNNSMRSRADYLKKFARLGIDAALDELYCSSYSAAAYLRSVGYDAARRVYVVGEQGIVDELRAAGYDAFGGPDDARRGAVDVAQGPLEWDRSVGAVVAGVDLGLNYYKVAYASLCLLQNPGCLFVATNCDSRGHFVAAQEWPGAGATVGAIKAVVEREPVVTGKPATFLLGEIVARLQAQPTAGGGNGSSGSSGSNSNSNSGSSSGGGRQRVLMVGDRLDTDVLWGLRANHHHSAASSAQGGSGNGGAAAVWSTLLVMTGVTDEAAARAHPVKPHFVVESFGDLAAPLRAMCAEAGAAAAAAAAAGS